MAWNGNKISEIESQLEEIATQVQGIEDNYILSEKYQNLLGSMETVIAEEIYGLGSATLQSATEGIIKYTCLQSYGSVFFKLQNVNPSYTGRKILFTAKVKSNGVAWTFRPLVYRYNVNTNLGAVYGTPETIQADTWITVKFLYTVQDMSITRLEFFITSATGNVPTQILEVKEAMLIDVTDDDTFDPATILDGYWENYPPANVIKILYETQILSKWQGKKALVIGDSLTAAGVWQLKLNTLLDMDVTTHAKGGISIQQMIDGSGDLPALSTSLVGDKDLIILFGGYNNRAMSDYGDIGDVYPTNNTLIGVVQYAINSIYALLSASNNLDCKFVIVTPHCTGANTYIPVDAYGEYPVGSGNTGKMLADKIQEISEHNSVKCYNSFRNSGIGKHTWSKFASSEADKLHLNTAGYEFLGERIATFVETV